jgi:hypothetical protein
MRHFVPSHGVESASVFRVNAQRTLRCPSMSRTGSERFRRTQYRPRNALGRDRPDRRCPPGTICLCKIRTLPCPCTRCRPERDCCCNYIATSDTSRSCAFPDNVLPIALQIQTHRAIRFSLAALLPRTATHLVAAVAALTLRRARAGLAGRLFLQTRIQLAAGRGVEEPPDPLSTLPAALLALICRLTHCAYISTVSFGHSASLHASALTTD